MATYDSLTQDEKDKLAFFTTQLRAQYGALARFLDGVDNLRTHYTAQSIGAIFTKLDAGAIVPNASGLAGSTTLTKTEWSTAVTDMSALLTAWWDVAAKREAYDKMAGPVNTSG
jgi:hypothetical protein